MIITKISIALIQIVLSALQFSTYDHEIKVNIFNRYYIKIGTKTVVLITALKTLRLIQHLR